MTGRRLRKATLAAACTVALLSAACADDADPEVAPIASDVESDRSEASTGPGGSDSTDATEVIISDSTDIFAGSIGPDGSATGRTPCPPADGSGPRVVAFENPPPLCIDTTRTYMAVVNSSKGPFTILLDDDRAPVTTNNFVVLSRYHFFDGVAFHRIIPNFVIQTGDATGDPPGSGGPGYQFDDEITAETYPDLSVAMANSGADTNGSQWFVVLPGGGSQLDPLYSRFGLVNGGQEVVLAIGAAGTASAAGTPTEDVRILSVTIVET